MFGLQKRAVFAASVVVLAAISADAYAQGNHSGQTASYSSGASKTSPAKSSPQPSGTGVVVGAYAWKQDWQGTVSRREDSVRVDGELGFDEANEVGGVVYAQFDHGVRWLPRVKLQYSDIQIDNRSNANFNFGGRTFDTDTDAHADLSHGDATFFYTVLDSQLRLDLGLTVRAFNGEVTVEGTATTQTLFGPVTEVATESADIDDVVPLLFAGVDLDTGLANIHLVADISGGQRDEDKLVDVAAGLRIDTDFGLRFDGGFRRMDLDIEQDEDAADVQIDGAYLGLSWRF